MQTPHQNYPLNFPKVNLPILISLGSNLGGIFLMDWDVIEVWWLCGWVLYDPTKFTFRLNVAQPPRKEGREGCKIRDIGSRSRKDVWEFVDVVSGSSFKASDKCWIKYMILSVWHFSPSEAYNSDNCVYICHLRHHGRSSKCFRTSSGFTSPKTGDFRSLSIRTL